MKQYVDYRREAKPSKVRVDKTVKIRVPEKHPKYRNQYKVLEQVSPTFFRLSDGNIWNVSQKVIYHTDSASRPQTSAYHSSTFSNYSQEYHCMWPPYSDTSFSREEDLSVGVAPSETVHIESSSEVQSVKQN